jgi:Asp-tRNA(Asn)/Glu-tRNA(Gln) amidotransferase A subunit family amidase
MAAYYGDLLDEHRDRMDPTVVALIEHGRSLSAVDLKRIELHRTDLWHRVRAALRHVDVLVCPTMSTGPWPAAAADRPRGAPPADGRHHAPDMTAVFNLVPQCPAASVPVGLDRDGLPIGMQVVGHRWREDTVLEVARAVERHVPPVGRPPARR